MIGTGATVTFGTTSYPADPISISISGEKVPIVDVSTLGSTTFKEHEFGDLKETPELEMEVLFDPDEPPPVGTTETVTVTFPVPSGGSTGATYAGTGAIIGFDIEIPLEDKIVATVVVKFDGGTGPTFTDST